ncbi:TPA: hypothetical protein ACF2EA_000207, partial [Acinetobacter baumannii]
MSNKVTTPYPLFSDIDGSPLEAGFLFLGENGQDAELNPITVYWNEEKTEVATQPLRTRNGFIVKDNQPAKIFIDVDVCSISIKDRYQNAIHQVLSFEQLSSVNGVKSLIAVEQARATAAEDALGQAIVAAQADLNNKVTQEQNRAQAAEQNLQVQITTGNAGIKYFSTEAELLAFVPTTSDPKQAYAFDTKKLYLWNGANWIDEGLSQLDQAKQYVDLKLKNNALESLFDFNDSEQNTVARILSDGDIETAKFGKLSNLPESTLEQAKQYVDFKTKSLDEDSSQSLFDFRDKDESIVAQLLENGDLNLAALDGKGVAQFIKLLLSVSANSSEDSSILKLHDIEGNLVFDFTNDGDVIFGGGRSLKALAHKESNSVIGIPSSYELLTDDFNSLISSYRNLSHISDLPIPTGLCSQKFKISNKAEFLNLKISQAERLKIDTPYYQDDHVVHPFLCNFYKTFRGFKHLLLLTPYHNTDSIFENPCVYGSNDLLNFELLSDMPQPIYERYP